MRGTLLIRQAAKPVYRIVSVIGGRHGISGPGALKTSQSGSLPECSVSNGCSLGSHCVSARLALLNAIRGWHGSSLL
jgi:hypothetical protein